jgi:iron transport multicopper oxidase
MGAPEGNYTPIILRNSQASDSFKVPTLYTALSAPASLVNNPQIYGPESNAFVLPLNAIVEITLINTDNGPHPFHLHAHNFQVIARSGPGPDDGPALTPPANIAAPNAPMRRDTVLVYPGGYAVLRFKADNPGITLFHCHIEWHVEAGLTATFIEAPTQLQQLKLAIPQNHYDTCKSLGIPTSGNAAGNTNNWLDLTGANTEPPLNDYGALINPPSSRRLRRGLRAGQ